MSVCFAKIASLILLCIVVVHAMAGNQPQPQRPLTAIIVGAGPAGLCTALALTDICQTIHLVEKRPSFASQGSALVLKPNGLKALREINGELAGQLSDDIGVALDMPGVPGWLMPWWYLRDAILARVQQKAAGGADIQFHMDETLCEMNDDNEDKNGVVVTLHNSGTRLQGDFLIGADGVHSQVRELLGLPAGVLQGSTVFRGHVQIDPDDPDTAALGPLLKRGTVPHPQVLFGETFFTSFNYHPKIPHLLSWVVATKQEIPLDGSVTPLDLVDAYLREHPLADDDETEKVCFQEMRQILAASNSESRIPFAPGKIIDLSDDVLAQHCPNGGWGGRGRVALLGDAAHAMNPTDGQGGSQAFEDVVVLLRILRQAQQDGLSIADALRKFESTRLPRVKRIHDDQAARLQMRYRGEEPPPWTDEYREWLEAGV